MEGDSSYDRKRREICATALELFAERGFEGATLEAVADVLGYTKPALYYYFKSKEDLFRSLMLDSLLKADGRIQGILAGDASASDKLREVIRMYLDDHFTRRGYFSICHVQPGFKEKMLDGPERAEVERLSASIPQAIIGIIRQGVDSGEFMAEDPRVLGGIVFGMLSGLLIHIKLPVLAGLDLQTLGSRLDRIIIKGISA
jgi:AcrR family transcriptional regulator